MNGKSGKSGKSGKGKIPLRQCTGCREMKDKRTLIRVIRTPEDRILLDQTGRMNGRGAYLCPSADCLGKAMKNHGLERSLKSVIPEEVFEELKKKLEEVNEGT